MRLGSICVAYLTMGLLIVVSSDVRGQANAPESSASSVTAAQEKLPADRSPPNLGNLFKMHYDIRVKAFREQNPVFQNIVLVGDSITEGFDIGRYFAGRRVLNRGIGADVIGNALPEDDHRGVLRRLNESIFDCAASDVFLMIGINDLNSGRKPDVMEQGYRELLENIRQKSPSVRIHVQSLLPTSGKHAGRNADVLDFNQRLKKLAAEFDCDYIDLHSLMVNDNGELKSEFTADGLHLTPLAYEVWQEEILKAMKWE